MYSETIEDVSGAAAAQVELIQKSLPAYLMHSALAGAYLGFGVAMAFIFAGDVAGTPFEPLQGMIMGATFGIALSLVIMAGSELFTGNAMIMMVGQLAGRVGPGGTLKVWAWSWVGNLFGSLFFAVLVVYSGTLPVGVFEEIGAMKMTMDPVPLFLRAMLCNWLIVLAVWINFQLENPVAKLIMIWWCLIAFIGSGYEHSIANMAILGAANLLPITNPDVSWAGMAYNIGIVTAGNVTSGVLCLGVVYWYIAKSYGHSWEWSMEDNIPANVGGPVSDLAEDDD